MKMYYSLNIPEKNLIEQPVLKQRRELFSKENANLVQKTPEEIKAFKEQKLSVEKLCGYINTLNSIMTKRSHAEAQAKLAYVIGLPIGILQLLPDYIDVKFNFVNIYDRDNGYDRNTQDLPD